MRDQGGRPGLALWLRKPPGCGTGSGRVGCRRSPCADLLCSGSGSVSQGLPWCSIIDSCPSESSGMGAVPGKQCPVPFSSQGGSHEGAHWCWVRLWEGTFQGSGKGRSCAGEAGAHHTLLWFATCQQLHLPSALRCSKGRSVASALSDVVLSPPGVFPFGFTLTTQL